MVKGTIDIVNTAYDYVTSVGNKTETLLIEDVKHQTDNKIINDDLQKIEEIEKFKAKQNKTYEDIEKFLSELEVDIGTLIVHEKNATIREKEIGVLSELEGSSDYEDSENYDEPTSTVKTKRTYKPKQTTIKSNHTFKPKRITKPPAYTRGTYKPKTIPTTVKPTTVKPTTVKPITNATAYTRGTHQSKNVSDGVTTTCINLIQPAANQDLHTETKVVWPYILLAITLSVLAGLSVIFVIRRRRGKYPKSVHQTTAFSNLDSVNLIEEN
jgi:hypothetical protein